VLTPSDGSAHRSEHPQHGSDDGEDDPDAVDDRDAEDGADDDEKNSEKKYDVPDFVVKFSRRE